MEMMEVGGVLFPIFSHTGSVAFKKVLSTKSTGKDIITKHEDVIKDGEFQEPDEKNC